MSVADKMKIAYDYTRELLEVRKLMDMNDREMSDLESRKTLTQDMLEKINKIYDDQVNLMHRLDLLEREIRIKLLGESLQ